MDILHSSKSDLTLQAGECYYHEEKKGEVMTIIDRAKSMILNPRLTWQTIKSESTDIKQLILNYAAPLALIPPVSSFIGLTLFGIRLPTGHMLRPPLAETLAITFLSYLVSILAVFSVGLIINLLAPYFSSKADFIQSMKLAVYSATPVWLAGIFSLLPGLGVLAILGLYGIYLLVLGLPELLETPPDKILWYTVSIILVTIIVNFLLSAILVGPIFGPMYMRMMAVN